MSSQASRRQGRFAEQHVAEKYDVEHAPDEAEWYDAVNPRTGTKYEVKSTHKTLANGASGRFRLWADQHRLLAGAAGADGQTAWYVFVLLSPDGEIVGVRRMKPQTVTRLIEGTWNRAGHNDRGDGQHKLPYSEVFSL